MQRIVDLSRISPVACAEASMRLRTQVTLVFFVAVIAAVSYLSLDRPHPAAHKGWAGNPLASNQHTNGRSSVANSLLDQSSTRLTWRVYCLPGGVCCTFKLIPMQVR
jgi:hypothetical protein